MPTQDEIIFYTLKGIVSELPEQDRMNCEAAIADIRKVVTQYGNIGYVAVAYVGAELCAKL